MMMAEQS